MKKFSNSKFETYLMDQELEINKAEEEIEEHITVKHYEEFPEGFFTSL